jgi:CRP-like cAMP-binding protein
MPQIDQHLAKFENLSEAVSCLSPSHNYPTDVEIYKQGSCANDVYFIENGTVKMTRTTHEGQQVIVSLQSSGRFIGASSVILQKPFSVNAVTLTRCDLRRIEGRSFINLLKSDPTLCWQFQEMLCNEIYEQVDHTAELGSLSARSRLELLLWNSIHSTQSCPPPTDVKVHLPLKNKELADLIAVTPEHLSRMLRRMQDEGVIRVTKGWIVVSDLMRLWHPPTAID